ncbi:histone-lysine N-methyltransferase SETMAR-like [Oratosquilla oratoria]|uniref:histone-lysine N-methyltransferase SETMAR-like n=1 Tax=Oratosquilla oratoria TaxID=337810 RepID=UPI003F75D23A
MEKNEPHGVIKLLHLKGYSARQIHDEMKIVYGDDCLSHDTVVKWKRNFQTGHMPLTDEPRTGRPSLTNSATTVNKVEDLILEDRRVTIHVIKHEPGLSYGSVWKIIHDELYMSKVSARWVPRLLTPLQRQTRRDLSRQMLTLLEQDEEDFFGRLVTMDKSWIYLNDLETKEMSKEWKHTISPPPKKAKVQKSAGKIMLMRDFLKKKCCGMLTKGVRLLADNAPAHSSQAAVVETRRCGYDILPHPPYSPDLAPSDFFLFPEMKNPLRGRLFGDTDDVIQVVEQWFSTQSEGSYNGGLRKVKKRWEKCGTLDGDYYVEKY